MIKFINKKAFTLAEILMCLAVIGVITAMTIPIISTNTKEREFKAAKNKAYAVAIDAWEFAVADTRIRTDVINAANFNEFANYFSKTSSSDGRFVDKSSFLWMLAGDRIIVDVNNLKGPDLVGEDRMEFCVRNGSLEDCSTIEEENAAAEVPAEEAE